jgi:hypothetical protein
MRSAAAVSVEDQPDARGELRAAHEMLEVVSAFADLVGRELAATGETPRRRTVDTSTELTAQEAKIARLARDSLSNPERFGPRPGDFTGRRSRPPTPGPATGGPPSPQHVDGRSAGLLPFRRAGRNPPSCSCARPRRVFPARQCVPAAPGLADGARKARRRHPGPPGRARNPHHQPAPGKATHGQGRRRPPRRPAHLLQRRRPTHAGHHRRDLQPHRPPSARLHPTSGRAGHSQPHPVQALLHHPIQAAVDPAADSRRRGQPRYTGQQAP